MCVRPPLYDQLEDWSFEWDDGNERELAAHGIRPQEAKEVFLNGPTWRRDKTTRRATTTWMVALTEVASLPLLCS